MSGGRLRHRGCELVADARLEGEVLTLRDQASGSTLRFNAASLQGGSWLLCDEKGLSHEVIAVQAAGTWWIHCAGRTWVLEKLARKSGAEAHPGSLEAPMTGKVLSVLVVEGETVVKGQPLLVLSAMKMQVEIKSPLNGVVKHLPHAPGDQVEGGTPLLVVEPA